MTGRVLTGGLSSRFGSDKSRVVVPGGAGDMTDFSLRLLSSLKEVNRLAVSCRPEQTAALKGRNVILIPDEESGRPTPLKGLVAALRRLSGPVLAIPCDLPLMTPDILEMLIRARTTALSEKREAVLLRTTFIDDEGFLESLIGIYESGSLPFLEEALHQGRLGIWSAIPASGNCLVPRPDSPAFLNMNTPDEYDRAVSLLSSKNPPAAP